MNFMSDIYVKNWLGCQKIIGLLEPITLCWMYWYDSHVSLILRRKLGDTKLVRSLKTTQDHAPRDLLTF